MFNSAKVNSRVFPSGHVYFHEDEFGAPMFLKKVINIQSVKKAFVTGKPL